MARATTKSECRDQHEPNRDSTTQHNLLVGFMPIRRARRLFTADGKGMEDAHAK
jgi:hypothetical protein